MPTSKPLRQWLAASGRGRRSSSTRAAAGTSRRCRAEAMVRADPAALASGLAERLDAAAAGPAGPRVVDVKGGERRPHRDRRRELESSSAHGARPPRRPRPPLLGRRPRLHGLEHADPRPGVVRRARAGRRPLPVPTAAPTGSTAWSPPGSALRSPAAARPDRHRRPRPVARHRRPGALRDVESPVRIVVIDNDGGGIFDFLPQEEALKDAEFEALLGTPRASGRSRGRLPVRPRPSSNRGPRPTPGGARGRNGPDRGPGGPHRERRHPPAPLGRGSRGPGPALTKRDSLV